MATTGAAGGPITNVMNQRSALSSQRSALGSQH